MKNKIYLPGVLIVMAFLAMLSSCSHKTFKSVVENPSVESLTVSDSLELQLPEYLPWQVATVQGKLKMQGLPLSPSLNIFLEKDSLSIISVRAPFVGDVAKIEIDRDSVLAVNKMNKTYVSEDISSLLRYYPGGISDIQDLLLARFFLPGFNISENNVEDLVDVFYEDGQFNVVPKGEAEIEGLKYGFVVDRSFSPLMLVILPEQTDMEISVLYGYRLNGYDIRLNYKDKGRDLEAVLELKLPEFTGEAPKKLVLDKKYRRLGLEDFVRSF